MMPVVSVTPALTVADRPAESENTSKHAPAVTGVTLNVAGLAAEAGETVTGWPGEALGAGLQVPDGIVTLKLPVYPASVTVTGAGVALSDVNATVVGAATGNAGVGVGAGAELVGAGEGVGAEALIA